MYLLRKLLWVDCTAGAIVGVLVLTFSGGLSRVHGLPWEFLLFSGAANLLYATYSFSLALRSRRPKQLIHLLVFANLAWSVVCVGCALAFSGSATVFGLGHLVGEAIFVAGLARLEWSQRERLLVAA